MKKRLVFWVLTFLITSCGLKEKDYPKAENGLDAGREFLGGCLKGDFAKAAFYMLKDSSNVECLGKIEKIYRGKDREGRSQYSEASLNILNIENVTENIIILQYSNSYDKVVKKLKVVKEEGEWLVDFTYTFNPNL